MIRLSALAAIAAAAAAVTVLAVTATAGAARHPKLIGVVGKNDAYKITLKTAKGRLVKTLEAGTYTLVIHDDSAIHNYELDGPHGKSCDFTSIAGTGTKTRTLKLVPGKYKAYCESHESVMFQHFTVR